MTIKEKLKKRAQGLAVDIPALFLALGRRETPLAAKAAAWLAGGSALSPIDLIPDFIPVLGYLDDLIILPLLVALAVRLIPSGVMEECRERAREQSASLGKKRWLYALPVIAVWLLLALLIIWAVVK